MDLKNQVEAVLFAVGKRIEASEIARICRAPINQITEALKELENEYNSKDSALMITSSDSYWKINVREKYLPICRDLISETDLDVQTMETLAIIAYSQPCIQSDVIKKRTAKAYDHIKELVDMGFITKEPKGRSRLLKVTQKFFDYFDISREKAEEIFKQFHKDEQEVLEGEEQLKLLMEERAKEQEEVKKVQKERDERLKSVSTKLHDIDSEVSKLEVREPEQADEDISQEIDEQEAELEKERLKKKAKAKHLLKAMGKDISELEQKEDTQEEPETTEPAEAEEELEEVQEKPKKKEKTRKEVNKKSKAKSKKKN
ncbi:SMC-Scp complex subunit ScpB [Candidatus Woesearchaeota archaeon]|nr:SMC-Scp complex subunit ScpB [Candidatus Woesearchaeota archaeon]